MPANPLWYKDAVFYELYVRAFFDSNGDGHGDLPGLLTKLDYLQELGVTCIWLLPTFPSPLKDDGYDISDYYGVHPEYGTLEDFQTVVEAAHARSIRVIMDLVLNHTSDKHPWFQAARLDPASSYRQYYVWSDTDQRYQDARIIFLDTESANWAWDEVAGQYYWHRFYASQPDLNYDNPAVHEEIFKIARFWLDMGVDGFRADAVPYLYEREGTTCENLPETHAFLQKLRGMMNAEYPGRILVGEANQWPEDVLPYFGDGSNEFQMSFHFPVMPRVFMALRQGKVDALADILARTPAIPEKSQWCTFLRNHDELTLEMVTEAEREWMWQQYAPEARMRLNLGIRRRLAPLLDNDRRKIELAHSLLFTLPGSPVLYYGDEIGMGENIWLEDRNGVRTPMQWEEGPNAGFSSAAPDELYAPLVDSPDYDANKVNVSAQQADPGSLLQVIKVMMAERKQHHAFGRGGFAWAEGRPNPAVAAYWRSYAEDHILVLNNLSPRLQRLEIEVPAAGASRLHNLLTQEEIELDGSTLTINLAPYEYLWLKL